MVTPDPRVNGRVYLISDVGGNWRSDNHGDQWVSKSRGLANIHMVALAVAPSDSNVLYAASAAGIQRSMNAGADWMNLASTNKMHFTRANNYRALVVDPTDSGKVMAGTNDGRVLISLDHGNTWKNLGGVEKPFEKSVAISALCLSSDNGVLFAGSASGLRRFNFKSSMWNTPPIQANKIYDIVSFNKTIYVTTGKKIAWSSTRGVTWNTTAPISASSGEAYRLSVAGDATGAVKIFVGWRDGWSGQMFLSADGGSTWTDTGKNIRYDLAANPTRIWKKGLTWPLSAVFDPFNPNILYFSDYWSVFRSDDGGLSWIEKIKGSSNTVGSDIAFSGNQLFLGTMDQGLLSSSDEGVTFGSLIPGAFYDSTVAGHVWRVNVNGKKIVATNSPWNGPANQILLSENGGRTFRAVHEGLPSAYPQVNTVWDKGYMRALARDPLNPNRYYCGIDGDDGGGFFSSLDGGAHWTRPVSQPGSLRIYNGLAVDPVEPSRIYWTAVPNASGSGGGIYRSENYGASWSQVFSGAIFDLVVARDQTVYAAADSNGPTLHVSTNKGSTWSVLKKFEGSGTCEAIAINPVNSNQIAVSVVKWNGGVPSAVYLSSDKGVTWTDITANLPYGSGAAAMTFKPDGSALFLTRDTGSVYSMALISGGKSS